MEPSSAVTSMAVTTLEPEANSTPLLATPFAIDSPFTVMTLPPSRATGVKETAVVPSGRSVEYARVAASNAGVKGHVCFTLEERCRDERESHADA